MEKVFSPLGAVGVRCQAQGHPNMWTGAAGDLTTNPAISGRPALPPEPCTATLAGATWGITKPDWLDPFGVFWIYPSSLPTWTRKAPWGSHPGSILCRCLNPPLLTPFGAKQHQLCCVTVNGWHRFRVVFHCIFSSGNTSKVQAPYLPKGNQWEHSTFRYCSIRLYYSDLWTYLWNWWSPLQKDNAKRPFESHWVRASCHWYLPNGN